VELKLNRHVDAAVRRVSSLGYSGSYELHEVRIVSQRQKPKIAGLSTQDDNARAYEVPCSNHLSTLPNSVNQQQIPRRCRSSG